MVGGVVIEIIDVKDKNRVWVNCKEKHYSDTCAIYVERNNDSLKIAPGDTVW